MMAEKKILVEFQQIMNDAQNADEVFLSLIRKLLTGVVESLHQQGYQVTILASKHGNKSSSDKQMLSLHAGLTFSVQKLLELKFKQLTAGCYSEACSPTTIHSGSIATQSVAKQAPAIEEVCQSNTPSSPSESFHPPTPQSQDEVVPMMMDRADRHYFTKELHHNYVSTAFGHSMQEQRRQQQNFAECSPGNTDNSSSDSSSFTSYTASDAEVRHGDTHVSSADMVPHPRGFYGVFPPPSAVGFHLQNYITAAGKLGDHITSASSPPINVQKIMSVADKLNLISKMNKVTQRPQIPCHICGSSSTNHKRHMMIHTGEKPFACPYCPYKATQKTNIAVHIAHIHSEARPFKCPLCDYTGKSATALRHHNVYTHKKGGAMRAKRAREILQNSEEPALNLTVHKHSSYQCR